MRVAITALSFLVFFLVFLTSATVPAAATSPTLPVTARPSVDGVPAVGEVFTLHVRFSLDGNPDVLTRLHTSPLVAVLDDPWLELPESNGGVVEHAWRLRASAAGFWSLALAVTTKEEGEPYGIQGPCCGYGWSSEDAGAWDAYPDRPFAALPDVAGDGSVTASLRDGRVHLAYEAMAAAWLDGATLSPQVGAGSVSADYHLRAMSLDAAGWEIALDVADGGEGLAYAWSSYALPFPPPAGLPATGHTFVPHSLHGEVHCEDLRVARESDRAWIKDSWACTNRQNALHGVPVPGAAPLLLLLAGTAIASRQRVKG